MKRQNIILVNSQGVSKDYGIGSYIEYLKDELSKHEKLNVIYVEFEYGNRGSVSIERSKFTSIYITVKRDYSIFDTISSNACMIFHTILINTNIKNGIFHLNVSSDLELCKIAKENNFKVVLTQHVSLQSGTPNEYLTQYLEDLNRSLYSLIDGCIFLSEDTKKIAIENLGFSEDKSTVIYNGVKWKRNITSNKEIRKKMGFRKDDFIAIFVGRLERSKGIIDLIKAFKRFSNGDSKKKLIIIGTGDFKETLTATRESITNFFLAGFLDKEGLSDFYKIADIGILPSYSEQSSLAVIEMIHNDIPLILSDIAGFSVFQDHEVIKTSIDTVDNNISVNIESLSDNIQLLYENKKLRKELVENTAHYRKQLMNIKYTTAETISFYETIKKKDSSKKTSTV